MVLSHPEIPWSYLLISGNPNITLDMVLSHPELPWNYRFLSGNQLKKIKKGEIDEFKLLDNKNLEKQLEKQLENKLYDNKLYDKQLEQQLDDKLDRQLEQQLDDKLEQQLETIWNRQLDNDEQFTFEQLYGDEKLDTEQILESKPLIDEQFTFEELYGDAQLDTTQRQLFTLEDDRRIQQPIIRSSPKQSSENRLFRQSYVDENLTEDEPLIIGPYNRRRIITDFSGHRPENIEASLLNIPSSINNMSQIRCRI
jgi:hypothetical protein